MKRLFLALIFFLALAVSAQAASNVTFEWSASAGATGYKVYQSTTSGTFNKTTGKVCDTAALTCTVSNIADGTYYWVATAYDTAGNESPYSNQVTATLDSTAPNAPAGFKITVTVNVNVQ
jgi:fibronectin type 3 domain-containing protein